MSLKFYNPPSIEEIIARIKTYVKGELEQLNPTDQNNVIYSMIVALANLSNDNNKQILLDILPNVFPQYCKSEESLENFANLKNVPRTLASASGGKAIIQGLNGTTIQLGTSFIANNFIYKTTASSEIHPEEITLKSLSVNGTLVTAETISKHRFASGIQVTISGAKNSELNGTFPVSVSGENSFTYNISRTLTAEEKDGLLASAIVAELNLVCVSSGENTNLYNGDALALEAPVSGASSNAYVSFSGITGGTDIQSFDRWKERVVSRYQNPITYFNVNNIIDTARSVSGVTKVWVYPCTPSKGQCTVYFIRGNDENVIPDANEISLVSTRIKNLRTVKDDPNDVFVYAPTAKKIDFTFSSIEPSTASMKEAIKNSLKQLFEDELDLGKNLTELTYKTAIKNSFDMDTGAKLNNFTLSNLSGDIIVANNELPVLGNIIFN